MELIIIMEGGIIQNVLSPDPEELKNLQLTVVDYDAEGVNEDVLSQVQQSDGSWEDAIIFKPAVEQLELLPFVTRAKE